MTWAGLDQPSCQHLELGHPEIPGGAPKGVKMWQRDVTLGPGLLHGWRVGPASGQACVLVPASFSSFSPSILL